jgi:hypothetical protein
MAVFSKLHQDLATANRNIAEVQARIARQAKLVSELAAHGHNTTNAQNLLRLLQRSLGVTNADRQQIVRELSRGRDEQS